MFTSRTFGFIRGKMFYQPNIWSEIEGFNGGQLVGRFGAEIEEKMLSCYAML